MIRAFNPETTELCAGYVKKIEKYWYFKGIPRDTKKLFIFARLIRGFQSAFNEGYI